MRPLEIMCLHRERERNKRRKKTCLGGEANYFELYQFKIVWENISYDDEAKFVKKKKKNLEYLPYFNRISYNLIVIHRISIFFFF